MAIEWFSVRPGRRIIVYFLVTIFAGTFFLLLPISSSGQQIDFIDALFTATSAVCVTGLTVLDTGKDYSLFGQIVILILIQLGGLGIMTFATVLLMSAGARLSFQDRLGLSQTFTSSFETGVGSILKAVLVTTFTLETLGAAGIFLTLRHDFPLGTALFYSIFHSVSAFCNAGLSTLPSNLESYRSDTRLILIFSALIISGGLGFAVIREVYDRLKYKKVVFSLHTKLCITTTAILLAGGTVAILFSEWQNLLANRPLEFRIANAFFQSVTSRTAGFNTLHQQNLTEVSILVTIILMFIGACPGSTAGGVKTTTFAVIMLLVVNRFRGRQSVAAFHRSIDMDSIVRALTVFLLAILFIIAMFAAIMFTEQQIVAHPLSRGGFVDNLFEVVSAFGTVGLSLGITPHLNFVGKLVIIMTMFVGRVGLLTLAFSLIRPKRGGEVVYVEEPVMVG